MRKRADLLRSLRTTKNRITLPNTTNNTDLLADLARERRKRSEEKEMAANEPPVCYPPHELTQEQRDEIMALELAVKFMKEDRQIDDDEELARRMDSMPF